jgi:molybdenum cofactor cytidylyltransferase
MRNVGAVILAAGGSSRLGQPKQLINFRGETLVRRATRAAIEAQCAPVVVVVGENAEAIQGELAETSAVIVSNLDWERGLGTSIRSGLRRIGDSVDAVVLLTCDQPLVEASVIAELIAIREQKGKPIAASRYANTIGIPALFDRSCFDELLALSDDCGAKALIASRPNEVATVDFEAGAIDIDKPEDLSRLATL